MARLLFTDRALERVRELPRNAQLLRLVWRRMEEAADDPDGKTEYPPPLPHRQDARLLTFSAHDSGGRRWAFSVLFIDVADGLKAIAFEFNDASEYPDLDDE